MEEKKEKVILKITHYGS